MEVTFVALYSNTFVISKYIKEPWSPEGAQKIPRTWGSILDTNLFIKVHRPRGSEVTFTTQR